MSETILCPICETANAADASNCEVCGERLAPEHAEAPADEALPDAGGVMGFSVEEYSEEEDDEFGHTPFDGTDVSSLRDEATVAGEPSGEVDGDEILAEVPVEAVADDQFADSEVADEELADVEFELDGEDNGDEDDFDLAEVPVEAVVDEDAVDEEVADEEFDFAEDDEDDEAAPAPNVLYSPLDGTAYPEGTAEFEDGFGPMGEELVAEPPEGEVSDAEEPGFELDDDDDFGASPAEHTMAEEEPEPAKPLITPLRTTARHDEDLTPLPTPAVFAEPATLTIYQDRQPVQTLAIDGDELLIGRRDPISDAFPEIDLSEYDADGNISRKHAYIFRQNKHYTLYVTSNTGTQINQDLLDLGDRRELNDGDVIILAGKLAMKFQLPEAR
ncbi:MAG: FHA domain-containing protein [Bradymonadaceae bacterium]